MRDWATLCEPGSQAEAPVSSERKRSQARPVGAARPASAPVLNEPQAGEVLDGRFRILATINRGGMAWVYKGLDLRTGKLVALKIPLAHCECDAGFYSRFQREEAIGLTLDHPLIVKFVPSGVKKSRPYIVMEYLEGQSLAAQLRQRAALPEAEAARIASRVCEALDYLHRNGVVHRDLKPENILLCKDGSIRILDFGIAKSAQARRLTFGGLSSPVGTPDFIAPEQLKGQRGDGRTDLYSLGAILYLMTTGSVPYEGDNPYVVMNARLSGDPQAPRHRNERLSAQIEEIILHALEREPADRYPSAAAMKAELDDYTAVSLEGRWKRLRAPRYLRARAPLLLKMAAVLAAQVAAFLLLFWHFSHSRHGNGPSKTPAPAASQSLAQGTASATPAR